MASKKLLDDGFGTQKKKMDKALKKLLSKKDFKGYLSSIHGFRYNQVTLKIEYDEDQCGI